MARIDFHPTDQEVACLDCGKPFTDRIMVEVSLGGGSAAISRLFAECAAKYPSEAAIISRLRDECSQRITR